MTYIQACFPFLLLVALVSLIAGRWSTRRCWRVALGVALGGAALFSWPPAAWLGSGTLEWWYPVRPTPPANADAIVVLSGYVAQPDLVRPRMIVGHNTYVRCSHAAWLFHRWARLPVLACGGGGCSEAMGQVLGNQGVPADMIWLERRSARTYENALFAAEILRKKGMRRIVLVTDGFHMLRAEACFRKQGLQVVPAPCSFRAASFQHSISQWIPGATAISHNEETLHEWIGMMWYWSKGWL